MKQSPSEQNLYENLQPSKFSGEGFLGTDTRPVNEIIAEDTNALNNTGISKEVLVKKLKDMYQKAKEALGAEVQVAPDVYATFYESMGRIPSPFSGDGVFEKGEAIVINIKSEKKAVITSLSIHLIEKHDFFQGKGCTYRIDPVYIVELLNITPDK